MPSVPQVSLIHTRWEEKAVSHTLTMGGAHSPLADQSRLTSHTHQLLFPSDNVTCLGF